MQHVGRCRDHLLRTAQRARVIGTTPRGADLCPHRPRIPVIHILWINAGLSCDGDSVALTAATQPSIEEIALGALPGLPKVAVHWPLIDFDNGPVGGNNDFIEWFFQGRARRAGAVRAGRRGLDPEREDQARGLLVRLRQQPETGQPMTTSEWLDRLAPKALAILAVGTCATYGGIHAMAGNPTGAMGVPDYLGWSGSRRRASRSSACPAARSTRTTSPRPSSTCSTRPRARRR